MNISIEHLPRLYRELADWWPVLSAPEEYAEEAAYYEKALRGACSCEPATLLELGSGGGNNASHLKRHFQVTLVDLAPAMLKVSQALNPECEHIQGDMRQVRLGRQFDLVFIHDAIVYMTTEADLRQAMHTAYIHCRPGGAVLFAPDHIRENFKTATGHGGHDRGERSLRYLDWTLEPGPDGTYLYVMFIKDNAVFIAFLESLDGGEAQENLYLRVAERYGETLRDEVFAGIGVAPFGLPTPEKPRYMQPVIARLEQALGADACRALIGESLRDLPDEYYAKERELYLCCRDVDEYIARRKQGFVAQLAACQREGRLFFAQEVTAEVLAFVRREPEIGGGVRVGNVVYETKIPFLTKEYLAETDSTLKRYYYCHCPWAREAVRSGEKVAPIFCNCSAGFHKKPWEAALGQRIEVNVLESALRGDLRCRFAIRLPA
jgi:hypothetical protein